MFVYGSKVILNSAPVGYIECLLFYSLYIVGGVQWALNGLENQWVENKSCSASQFSTVALRCFIGRESLWCNRNDLGSTDPLEGQCEWVGVWAATILKDNWPTCRLTPPRLYISPFIHSHSLLISLWLFPDTGGATSSCLWFSTVNIIGTTCSLCPAMEN